MSTNRLAAPSQAMPADAPKDLLDSIEASAPVPEVRESYAVVEACDGDIVTVRVLGRAIRATRAVSCLVEPAVGDRVLVALSEESFVLAVLVRAGAEGVTLAVDGDVTLRARGGTLAMVGDRTLSLTSGERLELSSPELEVSAVRASFFAESLSYVGKTLDGSVDRLKLAARSVDRWIDRVSERVRQSFRTVEEIEKVKAKELDVDVEGNFTVHADSTLMSSEKLVKVDGEQIHLG